MNPAEINTYSWLLRAAQHVRFAREAEHPPAVQGATLGTLARLAHEVPDTRRHIARMVIRHGLRP